MAILTKSIWQKCHPMVTALLLGTLFVRMAYYGVWPFVAIILHKNFGLSATEIGLIFCCSGLTGAVWAVWVGHISDLIGRIPTLLLGMLTYAAAFLCLSQVETFWFFLFGSCLNSMARATYEPPSKALIADLTDDRSLRDTIYKLRYFLINVGAAIGPMVALKVGLAGNQETFLFSSLVFLFFALLLFILSRYFKIPLLKSERGSGSRFTETLRVLRQDYPFAMLIFASFFTFLPFSQIESILPLYLTKQNPTQGLEIYTWLFFTNAATVVTCQLPLGYLMRKLELNHGLYIGLLLYGLGFFSLASVPTNMPAYLYASMYLISLGECICFPLIQLKTDRMSPPDKRGAYFGATVFSGLAFSVGPLGWGVLMDMFGQERVLYFAAFSVFIAYVAYVLSSHLRERKIGTSNVKTSMKQSISWPSPLLKLKASLKERRKS